MRNLHILPTDKPSRLWINNLKRKLELDNEILIGSNTAQHIYITNSEEIKDVRLHKGKWHLEKGNILNKFPDYLTDLSECKLIIMTTDPDLIKEGIQAIDNEFLEWFVNNPSCKNVKVKAYCEKVTCQNDGCNVCCQELKHRIIILKEEPKQENFNKTIGKEIVDYCKQYEDTDKYDVAMLAIEFGYQLSLKQYEK